MKLTNEQKTQRKIQRNILRLTELKEIVWPRKIEILSKEYLGCEKHLDCRCLICNYKWLATPGHLKHNRPGCPNCVGQIPKTIEEIKQTLLKINIKLLCDTYKNNKTKILCECLICKHKWRTTINNLINGGFGCPKCAGSIPKPLEEIKETLLKRNIKLICNTYKNANKKEPCECLICGYEWESSIDSLINNKSGCPNCVGLAAKPLEEIKQILLERNIKLLCDIYKNNSKKEFCVCEICKWEWKSSINNVLNKKRGCPKCASGFGEKACRFILETLFNTLFPNTKFKFRKNGRRYEIDCYSKELNLPIEINGRQHYRPVKFGGISQEKSEEKFIKQQDRDIRKRQEVFEVFGRQLIEINNSKCHKFKELIELIKIELRNHNIRFDETIEISEEEFYKTLKIDKTINENIEYKIVSGE